MQNDRLIPNNPALRTKIPRIKTPKPGQVWTMAHLRTFLESIRTHRLYAFYHLAAYTGARRGELLALRWSAIDVRKGTITLSASTDVIDGQRVTDTPKSGRSRTIGIDPGTVAVLGEHRRQQSEQRVRLGPAWMGAGDYVFTREGGQQLYPDTVTQLMSRFVREYNQPHRAGRRGHPRQPLPPPEIPLPRARLHDLRHLHATTLLLAGEAVHVVSNRLGHSDPAITLRVYAHVINESSLGPANAFSKAVADLENADDQDS